MSVSEKWFWGLFFLHVLLLGLSIFDYRVSADSGYHVAIGRRFGEYGFYWWDHINYGPQGRPHLQGPFLHLLIGLLGRLLGGRGDDYILANSLLAILLYAFAMWTVWHLARRYQGESCAILAFIMFTGAFYASWSFYIGIPSGWNFVLIPWVIDRFLQRRLLQASILGALTIHTHVAGYTTVPTALCVATLLTRRWRDLLIVGAGVMLLCAPNIIRLFLYRSWFVGSDKDAALLWDPLLSLLALPGLFLALRRWRENIFQLSFLGAGIPWLITLPSRFLLQSTLAQVFFGALFLEWLRPRLPAKFNARLNMILLIVFYTWPLTPSNLVAELTWATGIYQDRHIDWGTAKAIGKTLMTGRLTDRLILFQSPQMGNAVAVYAPITIEDGQWVEVQPSTLSTQGERIKRDVGSEVDADKKLYVLKLDRQSEAVRRWETAGYLKVLGDVRDYVIFQFKGSPAADVVRPEAFARISYECGWLAGHTVRNTAQPFIPPRHRQALTAQGAHAACMQIHLLIYALALQPSDPQAAFRVRSLAKSAGYMSTFLSARHSAGLISEDRHALMIDNLRAVAQAGKEKGDLLLALGRLYKDFFKTAADEERKRREEIKIVQKSRRCGWRGIGGCPPASML